MKHSRLKVKSMFRTLMALCLLMVFVGCGQEEQNANYRIFHLKSDSEKQENDYIALNRGTTIVLEVEINDRLSTINSEIFFTEEDAVRDFYSFRRATVTKVLKGDPQLEGQLIIVREPVALRGTSGYEYYEGQLDTCLKEGLIYLVYLDEADSRGMYPISNEGFGRQVLTINQALNEEWMLLTFLNYYGGMMPRKYAIQEEEQFETDSYDLLYVTFGGKSQRLEYYYDVQTSRTYLNINGKYYSVGGKVLFQ